MSQSVEISAADVESAIAQALAQLGVSRDQVRIEILEEPTRRLLGLGVRPARLRVTVEDGVSARPVDTAPVAPTAPLPVAQAVTAAEPVVASPGAPSAEPDVAPAKPAPNREPKHDPKPAASKADEIAAEATDYPEQAKHQANHDSEFAENDEDHAPPPVKLTDAQSDREMLIGIEVVQKLIGYLGMTATVNARRVEAVDSKDSRHWVLEVSGEELALLIGSKGETLGALQYLTRLIAARQLGHRVNLVVDVAGYKSHREDMLRRLAKRMANQAIETNRSVSLEPMPPHERRIIHLTLRDHPSVKTESVGEGDRRKVTIVPRRN